ncbi:MAG: hypothetical protein AMS26_07960 [Bacteroides sp. SM23_62]|nr:MAG: hypothetical protein AMS26_07960 [Bacteroides sp. SM23_62]
MTFYNGIMVLLPGITALIGEILGFISPGSSLDILFKNPENRVREVVAYLMIWMMHSAQVNSLKTTWN